MDLPVWCFNSERHNDTVFFNAKGNEDSTRRERKKEREREGEREGKKEGKEFCFVSLPASKWKEEEEEGKTLLIIKLLSSSHSTDPLKREKERNLCYSTLGQ